MMPLEPMTPPPAGEQEDTATLSEETQPGAVEAERPHIKFSVVRWAATGVVRLLYRYWTRIAAHLFPENSVGERVAQALHIPLPDTLNLSWVNGHLAVGGRIRPEDVKALRLLG